MRKPQNNKRNDKFTAKTHANMCVFGKCKRNEKTRQEKCKFLMQECKQSRHMQKPITNKHKRRARKWKRKRKKVNGNKSKRNKKISFNQQPTTVQRNKTKNM